MSHEKNTEICCSLGMHPLSFESLIEQECFSSLLKCTQNLQNLIHNYDQRCSDNWTKNSNYWTDGIKKDSAWHWSVANLTVPSTLQWDVSQPDNKNGNEDCLHVKLFPGVGVKLTDRSCSHKYIYACQVSFSQ
jgi:hypothetical protein